MRHPDFSIISDLMAMQFTFLYLFIYCYFGKMATESYTIMADTLFECNWHELNPKLQKYFVIMIAYAQEPMYYHGFGVVVLNLETFTSVNSILNFDSEHIVYEVILFFCSWYAQCALTIWCLKHWQLITWIFIEISFLFVDFLGCCKLKFEFMKSICNIYIYRIFHCHNFCTFLLSKKLISFDFMFSHIFNKKYYINNWC